MSEQRNLILAIVLSVAILFGFQTLFPGDPPPPPPLEAPSAGATGTPGSGGAIPGAGNGTVAGSGAAVGITGVPGTVPTGAMNRANAIGSEPRIRIDTPRLHGSIRLRGAWIDDLTLADYRQTTDPTSPEIELLNPRNAPDPYFVDFGWLNARGSAVAVPTAETVWAADRTVLAPGQPVILTWDNGGGLTFIRRFAIDDKYMFTVEQSVRNSSGQPVTLHSYGRVSRHGTPETSGFYILHEGMLGSMQDKVMEVDYDTIAEDGDITEQARAGWIGFTDKYWMTMLIPDAATAFEGAFRHTYVGGVDKYQTDFLAEALTIAPGSEITQTNRLFAGAKEVDLINSYAERLGIPLFENAIDWGWFPFLTKPLFIAIDFFNGLLGNLGLAIIATTIIIKTLFLPLAYKSYVSMNAMKELQPEMVKIRERYGEDRQRMQQEMMGLYKKNKVNPVSGCVPILLQIPVFFALYKVLFVTIEMRHAPFYGWIQDLSAPDPTNIFTLFGLIPWDTPDLLHLGIWPILMGGSMWLLQKMNPTPPDPMQARIMMMLPIVFTFFLARFPAGLVIYWTANNLLSIGQQYVIKRQMAAKKKRLAASGGAGK
ncbi:MAG: membrane protein insertase YidC [Minwuia sp.]|nr:membrane protein insertase YidC [Minwuia sp.]